MQLPRSPVRMTIGNLGGDSGIVSAFFFLVFLLLLSDAFGGGSSRFVPAVTVNWHDLDDDSIQFDGVRRFRRASSKDFDGRIRESTTNKRLSKFW
ncbi:hypothetical protein FGIG_08411 [Fasciola gigantica]|uniref:Uncharacterized protein n=1 Tax=Fasciola gigantica TaxID=46835 RepID=A0A504Y895_FASGI|nr:hypothetical protein FGIG_08411 [Fasciola gigantica]